MLGVVPHPHLRSPSSSIPELLKTKGQVVVTTSAAAQVRAPNASEYCISKHAINRFAEFITIGNPDFWHLHFPLVLNIGPSLLYRVSRHQGLLRPPWHYQDRFV